MIVNNNRVSKFNSVSSNKSAVLCKTLAPRMRPTLYVGGHSVEYVEQCMVTPMAHCFSWSWWQTWYC